MEINLKTLSEQAVESTTGSKKMRLSENAASMVFQLFTKNVYSNPIGTVVREITSNCFDSHIEAKVNAPVLIKKGVDPQTNSPYISFIDYGVGMSPDRVDNIYGVYFESTKRVDNTQIGGFGIGGKSPLAYKRPTGLGQGEYDNSFYVITVFDKVKYYYSIFEGAESPEHVLLHSEPTEEGNGTEVRIPILDKDYQSFTKEMVRQLYYFENVIFEGFDDDYRHGETLSNSYQIIRGKSFLYRGKEYSDAMHVCLGRVAYPIDYNVLGLSASDYRLPIALKLEIGEIGVTASREMLDYSEGTIKTLKKKLEVAKTEVIALMSKQYEDITTLEDYFKVKNNFGKLFFPNNSEIFMGNMISQKDVTFPNFKYQFLQMPNDKKLFRFFFESKAYGKKPKRSRYNNDECTFDGGYDEIQGKRNLFYVEDEFIRKVLKQAYLKEQFSTYFIVERRNLLDGYMKTEIADLFNVHTDKLVDDNGKATVFVQSLIDMQEDYFEILKQHAHDYDKLVIPEGFKESRKRNVMSPEMRNTTIPVKFIGGSKSRVTLDKLFDFQSTIYYGNQNDEYKLLEAYRLFNTLFDSNMVVTYYDTYYKTFDRRRNDKKKGSIMFIVLAENNLKYMQYCKHAQKVDHFYNTMLKRKENVVLQYFQTYELVQKYSNIDSLYKSEDFVKVDAKWGKKIIDLKNAIKGIPEKARDTSIGYMRSSLEKYFDLKNIKPTADQKKVAKQIEEISTLQTTNAKILRFINMPYNLEEMSPEFSTVLKKVMAL